MIQFYLLQHTHATNTSRFNKFYNPANEWDKSLTSLRRTSHSPSGHLRGSPIHHGASARLHRLAAALWWWWVLQFRQSPLHEIFPKQNSYARLLRRISLVGIAHRGWSRSHHRWAGTVLLRRTSLWSGHLWAHSLVRHAWVHISWSWISHVSYLRWRRNPLPGGRIGPAWAPMTCWFGPAMLFGGDIIEAGPLWEVIGLLKMSNWIIFRVWKKSKFFLSRIVS